MKRTPMPRPSKPIERHTPLRQVSAKKAAMVQGSAAKPERPVSTFRETRPQPAVSVEVRVALRKRAGEGWWCEAQLEDCWGQATDPHHRITRKDGGRQGEAKERSDRLSNLIYLCRHCHNQVHQLPARSYRRRHGWLLRESADPTQCPVRYRGRLAYLADDGSIHSKAPVPTPA